MGLLCCRNLRFPRDRADPSVLVRRGDPTMTKNPWTRVDQSSKTVRKQCPMIKPIRDPHLDALKYYRHGLKNPVRPFPRGFAWWILGAGWLFGGVVGYLVRGLW